MENKVDMFFLSPRNQDRVIKIMDELKGQGYPANNRTMTVVLHVMREKGLLPQANNQEIIALVKKVVPPGGKILHIRGGLDEHIIRTCGG